MALGVVRVERHRVERPPDVAPQRREEVPPAGAEQGRRGGRPLPLHPVEPFEPLGGSVGGRRLQRRDQRDGMEPVPVIAIDPDEPVERPPRPAGIPRRQCIQQRVDRRGLGAVDEEIELSMLPVAAKPRAQQGIQCFIGGCRQHGARAPFPTVMNRRLGVETQRHGPRLRPFEPWPHFARATRQDRVQIRETALAPRPIVLVAEPVRRQQQIQRRVFAVLHHELLHRGLQLRGAGVPGRGPIATRRNHGHLSTPAPSSVPGPSPARSGLSRALRAPPARLPPSP